jgi:hypothetical protein
LSSGSTLPDVCRYKYIRIKRKGAAKVNGIHAAQVIHMKSSAQILDISTLPAAARREFAEFYQFLMQRYGRVQKKQAVAKHKLPTEFYKPIAVSQYQTVSRDEIYRE